MGSIVKRNLVDALDFLVKEFERRMDFHWIEIQGLGNIISLASGRGYPKCYENRMWFLSEFSSRVLQAMFCLPLYRIANQL